PRLLRGHAPEDGRAETQPGEFVRAGRSAKVSRFARVSNDVIQLRIAAAAALLVACGGTAPVVAPTNQDTLEAHARAQDDEGLKRASLALDGKAKEEGMRAPAAVLEYEPQKITPLVAKISERATKGEDETEK